MVEMAQWRLDAHTAERLHRVARAEQWGVSRDTFTRALERGVRHALGTEPPDPSQLERHLASLRLEDLALACACAEGHERAWEHFVREYRPVLYRAASALDASGGARDLADALYAELFGLAERDGTRRSHFEYFHGRSSLATWLRAVLAQRSVDRARAARRLVPLPDEEPAAPPPSPPARSADHGRFVALIRTSLAAAVGRLAPRDRLRLACYYAQDLTLAQVGRALGEHEATVSRQLAKARKNVREDVERQLREAGLNDAAIAECLAAVAADPGPLDVADLLEPEDGSSGPLARAGKNPDTARSR
jgi:RNA polymerase sigma factor (sigma-70 family)